VIVANGGAREGLTLQAAVSYDEKRRWSSVVGRWSWANLLGVRTC